MPFFAEAEALVKLLRRLALAAMIVLMGAGEGRAQSDNTFALGANVSLRGFHDESARGHNGLGLLWRLGHGDTGWGWQWALNWVSADIDQTIAGSTVRFGQLRVRPVMAGYGYSYRRGRQLFTASVVAGYAFVSMTPSPTAIDAYYDRLGARSVTVETSNVFVVRPEFSVWHDLSEKVGLNASTGFLVARPRVTVRSTLGEDERRIRADMFYVKIGLAYSIF
jgi:hypothetical protein